MFDNSGSEIADQMSRGLSEFQNIRLPEFEDVNFNPLLVNPELIQESPMVLASQLAALEKMKSMADEGLSAQDNLAMARANQEAGQRARQAKGAALQNAMARGVAGGGMEFALGEMANQGAAERARMQGMEQAAESAKMRALNQMNYANSLGNVRNQDFQSKQANTGIMNQFNTMNTNMKNQAELRNIDQSRANKQQNFDNALARASGVNNARTGVANAYAAQGAANQSTMNALMGLGGQLGGAYLMGGI